MSDAGGARSHRPRRRFSQNFLHDRAVAERIVDAIAPRRDEHLVEIGPGRGALTDMLAERAGRLDLVEIDRDLAEALSERLHHRPNVALHRADALTFDFRALASGSRELRVVGNLPYHISTPLVFHLLDQRDAVRDMHFMLQREVVQRMVARSGGADYGRLSIMVQWLCETEKLFDVGSGAFTPAPRVTSAVVRLSVRDTPAAPVEDAKAFASLVAQLFSQRRKTLRRILKGQLQADTIAALGIAPERRPQTLELEEIARLANALDHANRRADPSRSGR